MPNSMEEKVTETMEPEFKLLELEDREILQPYLQADANRSCERTFANIYLWKRQYPVEYAFVKGSLVFRSVRSGSFSFPVGGEDKKAAVRWMLEQCEREQRPFQMHVVLKEEAKLLEEWFPDRFSIVFNRDTADYLYETQKLQTLTGKKYHAKRNYINRFLQQNADWSYEQITSENAEECFQMAQEWRRENGCEDDPDKNAEMCVTFNALRLLDELSLTGGLIRVDGRVVAFAIGEPACGDTFVVHIEKAYAEVDGAYPMINQQFALHAAEGYTYINREDDMGEEGLRRAKLSYQPVDLIEKAFVTLKEGR